MPHVDVDKLIAYFQGEWNWHDCECIRQFAEDGEFEPVIHGPIGFIYFLQTNVLTVAMKQAKLGGPLNDALNVGHI